MRERSSGFGIVELIVTIGIAAALLAAGYRFATSVSRKTAGELSTAKLSRDVLALRTRMVTEIQNLGFNPTMTPYSTADGNETADDSQCTPPRLSQLRRIGPTLIEATRFLFTSDDDVLYDPDECTDPDSHRCDADKWCGKIQDAERYGFWAATDDPADLVDFSAQMKPDAEPCTPLDANSLTQPVYLWGRAKRDLDHGQDVILATNLLCLEFRYFRRGQQRRCWSLNPGIPCSKVVDEETWERLWEDAENVNYRPPASGTPAYHSFINENVHRVGVTMLLRGQDARPERVHFDVRLENLPWRMAHLSDQFPFANR